MLEENERARNLKVKVNQIREGAKHQGPTHLKTLSEDGGFDSLEESGNESDQGLGSKGSSSRRRIKGP